MSQSRNRRMSPHNREAGSGTRAGAPDGNPTDFVTNARTLDSKNTNKIPKELRYDLENALLGLCDVWFDEIKPHLVKNNLKVHTGGALNENYYGDLGMAGDRSGANRGEGRRELDPGAASDQRPGICEAFSPTPRVESSAPCRRRPAPCRPRPLSPSEFHNLLKSISRIKTRRKETQKESQSPPLPIQPSVKSAVRYPRCTACGFVSSQGQVSKTPLRHQSDRTLLSWTHAAGSQRPIRTNNLLLSRPQYTSFQTTKSCAVNNRLSTIESVSDLSPQCEASKSSPSEATRSQLNAKIHKSNFTNCPLPSRPHFERESPSPQSTVKKSSTPRRTTSNSPSRPRTPNVSPRSCSVAKPPKNKRPVSPPPKPSTRIVGESGAVLAPWLHRTSQNNWLSKPRDQIRRATKNSQTFNNNLRPASSKTILFPVEHERKKQIDGESSLFSKDLINLIGEKYDARIKVLYQNPKREESYPSIMCLSGRNISTTKSTWK